MINKIILTGNIKNLKMEEEKISCDIVVQRLSHRADIIPVVADRDILCGIDLNTPVEIRGYVRTRNENKRLVLTVVATQARNCLKGYKNQVLLTGSICKEPQINEKRIAHLIIGTTCAYIPCVAWDPVTEYIKDMKSGEFVILAGRLQSRTYRKIVDGAEKAIETYEIAVSMIEEDEDHESNNRANEA